MKEKFEEYNKYLQEYEISSIIAEAENNLSEKQKLLESALSSATATTATGKSTASAETIAECAFEALKTDLKHPHSATLDKYLTDPQRDSYGRVATTIVCSAQNDIGNYLVNEYFVVLQSCTDSGQFKYLTLFYYKKPSDFEKALLLTTNLWDKDPNYDSNKDPSYNEIVSLIKEGKYSLAIEKLNDLGDYRKSFELKSACISYTKAEKYKEAVGLFNEKSYDEASNKLMSLLKDSDSEYLRSERIITLCNIYSDQAADEETESDKRETDVSIGSETGEEETDVNINSETGEEETDEIKDSSHEGTASSGSNNSGGNSSSAIKPSDPCGNGHKWIEATCTSPATCSVCGKTSGLTNSHSWTEITETVHHDSVGHYETVQEAKSVKKYKCSWFCGYDSPKFDTLDEYYAHFDEAHSDRPNSAFLRDRYDVVDDWEYYDTQKWVVDSEAYDETVVIGYKCSVCGKTK